MTTPERLLIVTATALAVLTTACGASEGRLPKERVTALEGAFNRNDAKGAAALFADDAEIIPEVGHSVKGREEIDAYFREQIADETAFDTDSLEQIVRDDLAIDQGTYRVRNVVSGKDVEMGRYLAVWKNLGGNWKMYRLMYSTDVAPRASMTVAEEEGQNGEPAPN